MNNLRNNAQLIGHLGATPVVKKLGNDKTVASFSLATKETFYTKEGERKDNTQWHNLVCWNKTAQLADQYLDKGSHIAIQGKLTTDVWEDKEGNKRYTTKVIVNDFIMLGNN